ncbi:hypothetical protein AAVH_12310 [Aphelenchoides avenae]|nr:hypothetical protein AAVH_12310 [Aphelenchus avenae]
MPRGSTPVRRQKTPVRNPFEGGDVDVFAPMPSKNTKAGLQAQRAGVKAFDQARVAGRANTPVRDANVARGRSPAHAGVNARGTTPSGRAATPAKKEENTEPKRRGRPPKDAQSTPHQMALRERTPAGQASRGRSPAVSAAATGRAGSRARTPVTRGKSPGVSVSTRAPPATGRGRSPATVTRDQPGGTAPSATTTRGRSPAIATRSQPAARVTRGQSQATASRGKSPAYSTRASVARGQSPAVARGGRKRQGSENPPVAKKRSFDVDELFGGSSESDDASVEMSKPDSGGGLEQNVRVVTAQDVISGEVDLNRIVRLMAHPLNDPAFVQKMMDDLGNLITLLDEKHTKVHKLEEDVK